MMSKIKQRERSSEEKKIIIKLKKNSCKPQYEGVRPKYDHHQAEEKFKQALI